MTKNGSQPRLKVLILHQNADLAQTRRTSFNHAFCLLKYAPWNDYELHSFGEPITQRLRRERFDAIILDTTFLCWRWAVPHERYLERLLSEYDFLGDSDAVKVALPQDEYDQSERLDDWFALWRINLIYSASYAHRDLFYPKASQHAEIVEALTGYIDDADIAMMQRIARPFKEREIDVGYRAKYLPAYFGRLGRLKAEIGERFLTLAQGSNLRVDIAIGDAPQHVLLGDAWLKFLGDCRFTLGCEGGSSLLDPRGQIRAACEAYLSEHPEAAFDEVEAACFPGQDMKRVFSAVSPRVFEAALAGSCQVLVPGNYLGVLNPDEHYIPLAADFSNFGAVLDELRDWQRAEQRVEACRQALLCSERFSYRGFVADLLARIESRLDGGAAFAPAIATLDSRAESVHELATLVVRTAIKRASDLQEADIAVEKSADTPLPLADQRPDVLSEPSSPDTQPTICILALSPIADDPRVRRQAEAFHSAGWKVAAVGLPGAKSAPPPWSIPTRNDLWLVSDLSLVSGAAPEGADVASPPTLAFAPGQQRLVRREWLLRQFKKATKPFFKTEAERQRFETRVKLRIRRARSLVASLPRQIAIRIRPKTAERLFSQKVSDVYAQARQINATVWVANDWNMLPVAARLAHEKGGIYGYDTHEFATEEYAESFAWRLLQRPMVRAIERQYIGGAAVVSAVSDGIAERLDKIYRLPFPTLTIRNTPNFEKATFRPSRQDRIKVLYHGIVVPNRGIEAAIDSVALWRPEFTLTIRGPENPAFSPILRERITALGLGHRIRLAPAVPMTDLVREAASFDIGFFALPGHSRHNEFALPNKFFEYVMAGLALCTTDLPEMARLIRAYDLGVTIAAVEPKAIAAAINALDPGRIDRFKRNALAAARELCWERESERLVAAYAATLAGSRRSVA